MFLKGLTTLSCITLGLSITYTAFSESRIDFDIDNDGLIEINNLNDLNQIRYEVTTENGFNLIKGNSLYGDDSGCPVAGCTGYELTTDLNFDSNQDNVINSQDSFWNDGLGFEPIGNFHLKFTAEFHGNGHKIDHLTINRPDISYVGLFSYAENSNFHDLTIMANIKSKHTSGGLLGYGWNTNIHNIKADVTIDGSNSNDIGGLVGVLDGDTSVQYIQIKATVTGANRLGGVFGSLGNGYDAANVSHVASSLTAQGGSSIGGIAGSSSKVTYEKIYSQAYITGTSSAGGIIGNVSRSNINDALITGSIVVSNSKYARAGGVIGSDDEQSRSSELTRVISLVHLQDDPDNKHFIGGFIGEGYSTTINSIWANDLAKRNNGIGRGRDISGVYDLNDIQCANEDVNSCNGLNFKSYSTIKNGDHYLWDLGDTTQAPGMNLMSTLFIDADGNGETDNWPSLIKETPPVDDNKPDPIDDITPTTPAKKSSGGGSLQWFGLFILLIGTFRKNRNCV
ncbi:hypothetical protein ACU6U9_12680 [Pseudomonas sp. HK3]